MNLKKILIVEDSDLLHGIYGLLLMHLDTKPIEILHCMNGRQALETLNDQPDVDLILLDLKMPLMNALEFLTYRTERKVFQEIPAIIVSTEGKEQDIILALERGARGYLTMPFQASQFFALIDPIFNGGQS